jgi:hypothetical protein
MSKERNEKILEGEHQARQRSMFEFCGRFPPVDLLIFSINLLNIRNESAYQQFFF